MKKSLLALAVLGAFAGAASAQSSVTVYGKLDLGLAKPIGTEDKQVRDAAGSRLGFRGVEDLGGGLAALFNIEHRFDPDTGVANATFWNGISTVGLKGGFGSVNLGRQYTPTFSLIENQIDPFGGDTQGALRDVGMRPRATPATSSTALTKLRFADSIRYDFSASGFNFAAAVAEGATNGGPDKAYALAANYAAGPLFVGIGMENPGGINDKQWSIGARYNFGFATLSAGYSDGTTNADVDASGWLVGANVPLGAGDLKFGYAQSSVGDGAPGVNNKYKKASVGYHYNLSKRTKVYADYAKVGGGFAIGTGPKTGYDLGIQHNF